MPCVTYFYRCYCSSLHVDNTCQLLSSSSIQFSYLLSLLCSSEPFSVLNQQRVTVTTCIAICSLVQGGLSCCPCCGFLLLSLISKPVTLESQSIPVDSFSKRQRLIYVICKSSAREAEDACESEATQHLFQQQLLIMLLQSQHLHKCHTIIPLFGCTEYLLVTGQRDEKSLYA